MKDCNNLNNITFLNEIGNIKALSIMQCKILANVVLAASTRTSRRTFPWIVQNSTWTRIK